MRTLAATPSTNTWPATRAELVAALRAAGHQVIQEASLRGGMTARSLGSVDLAPMPDGEPKDQQGVVLDLVDHAVVAGAHPPLSRSAHQPSRGRRARVVGQQLDRRLDAPPGRRVEPAELTRRCGRERDQVGHVRPRSALTCSQGIGSSPVSCLSLRAAAAARMSDILGEFEHPVEVVGVHDGRRDVGGSRSGG